MYITNIKINILNFMNYMLYFGCGPLPVTVTTRIITFLVGNPYKPSFTTVTGRGPHPSYIHIIKILNIILLSISKITINILPSITDDIKTILI